MTISYSEEESFSSRSSINRITLRLPSEILSRLRANAEEKDMPVNAAIVRMLSKNTTFDDLTAMTPILILPAPIFVKVLQHLDDVAIKEMASECCNAARQMFMIRGIQNCVDEVIQKYLLNVAKYYNWYEFGYHRKGDEYRLTFRSTLGEKWLRFLTLSIGSILESLHVSHLSTWSGEDIVIFVFRL